MSGWRIERVSELVKQQVSEIVQQLNLTGCGFITVTGAKVSPDLKEGRIYVSVIGTSFQQEQAVAALQERHDVIQQELARRIVLKYTPRLKFTLDETEARAAHIEQLLNDLEPPAHE
jgi:ribosome-binding factor A